MSPILRIIWMFGGTIVAGIGVTVQWGWPALLIYTGLWAMLGTILDTVMDVVRQR